MADSPVAPVIPALLLTAPDKKSPLWPLLQGFLKIRRDRKTRQPYQDFMWRDGRAQSPIPITCLTGHNFDMASPGGHSHTVALEYDGTPLAVGIGLDSDA